MDWTPIIVQALVTLGVVLAGLAPLIRAMRTSTQEGGKLAAEGEATVLDSYGGQLHELLDRVGALSGRVIELTGEVTRLHEENAELRATIEELRQEVGRLSSLLLAHGIEPNDPQG